MHLPPPIIPPPLPSLPPSVRNTSQPLSQANFDEILNLTNKIITDASSFIRYSYPLNVSNPNYDYTMAMIRLNQPLLYREITRFPDRAHAVNPFMGEQEHDT